MIDEVEYESLTHCLLVKEPISTIRLYNQLKSQPITVSTKLLKLPVKR